MPRILSLQTGSHSLRSVCTLASMRLQFRRHQLQFRRLQFRRPRLRLRLKWSQASPHLQAMPRDAETQPIYGEWKWHGFRWITYRW